MNNLGLKGMLTGSDEELREGTFRQIAPGRYEARFTAPPRGINLLTVIQQSQAEGELATSSTVPFIVPFSKEYSEITADMPLLQQLARETGGEVLDDETLEEGLERLFAPSPEGRDAAQGTWWYFGVLGLTLFLVDLAARTFTNRRLAA